MDARLNLFADEAFLRATKHINSAAAMTKEAGLAEVTQQLVLLRASQINGCGMCTDMHTKDALHAGEDAQRLFLVSAWREATVFTEAERAALELTEQGTRLADNSPGVTDEVWLNATKHYDDKQLAALVLLIGIINMYNRINVITRQPAGDYQPGQWA